MNTARLDYCPTFRPGDLPPQGYLQWHEWADVQRLAGIKQVECAICGLWRTPQELTGKTRISYAQKRDGSRVKMEGPICTACEAKNNPNKYAPND